MTSLRQSPDIDPQVHLVDPHFFDALPLQEWPAQWHPTDRFPTPQSVGDNEFHLNASREISYSPLPAYYRLGDPSLPVGPYRNHILQTVAENQTTVISSPPGSGKSSQLGLWLVEEGYPEVYISQPRVVAARNLYEWTRQNLAPQYKNLVGYRTRNAEDSHCPPGMRIMFVTAHLLLKMLNNGDISSDAVVIGDEAHEDDPPTEIMLGYLKGRVLPQNPDMRAIGSSATINTDEMSRFLGGPDQPAPVLILPGRTHAHEFREESATVGAIMHEHIEKGAKVIGFEPGVARLKATAAEAKPKRSSEVVHLLYGDQSPRQQAEALNPDDHVVGSRVAQTSITPPGKTVAVSSGLVNIGGNTEGVRWLRTETASQADIIQDGGRVSRTQPGLAILSLLPREAPPQPPFAERPQFRPPAIENSSLASFVAELLSSSTRIEDLPLRRRYNERNLRHDFLLLQRLGAIAIEDGEYVLTETGAAMNRLALDPPLARMLVEAGRPVDNPEIDQEALQLQLAATVAMESVHGILDITQGSQRRFVRRKNHQKVLSAEYSSDVLFGLDVFVEMYKLQQATVNPDDEESIAKFERILEQTDILPNRYIKSVETYLELCRRLDLDPLALEKPKGAYREQIVGCLIAGAEELFPQKSKLMYHDIRGDRRTIGRRTTIAASIAHLVIGTAFDLHGLSERGAFTRKFISGGTVVTVEQLLTHAAHRVTRQSTGFGLNKKGQLVGREALYFDDSLNFAEIETPMPPTLDTRIAIMTALMTGRAPNWRRPEESVPFHPEGTPNATLAIAQWKRAQALQEKTTIKLHVEERYKKAIARAVRASIEVVPLDVTDPDALDAFIQPVYRSSLVRPTRKKDIHKIDDEGPDAIQVQTKEGKSMFLPVGYKDTIARITLPRNAKWTVRREDFEGVGINHDIKVRVGRDKYQTLDAFFRHVDEQREAEEAKEARRAERRAIASRRDPRAPTRSERRDAIEREVDAQFKAQARKSLSKRPNKGEPATMKRQRVRTRAEKIRKIQNADRLASIAMA